MKSLYLGLLLCAALSLPAQSLSFGLNLPSLSMRPQARNLTWYPGLSLEIAGFCFNGYADGRMNIGYLWYKGGQSISKKKALPILGLACGLNNAEFIIGGNYQQMRFLGFANLNWRSRQRYVRDSMPQPLVGLKLLFQVL